MQMWMFRACSMPRKETKHQKRVLLKLSGEALAGDKHTGFDEPTVTEVAKQVNRLWMVVPK